MNTKSITEGALIAVISLILSLISYYIPFFSGFTYFLMPIPIVVMYKRHGTIPAVLTSLTSGLLLLFFMDPLNAALLAAFLIFPGLGLGYAYSKNETGGVRVAYGYFGFFIAIAIEVVMFQVITGTPFIDEFVQEINATTSTLRETYQAAGLFEGEQGATLQENLDTVVSTLKMLLPSIMLVIPLAFSYCTVLITDLFFKRLKIKYKPLKAITEWRLSTVTKNVLAIVTLIVFLANYLLRDSNYAIYPYTLEVILTGIYTLMGFSFIFWFLKQKFHRNLILVRILILVATMMVSFLISIVMIIGVFDIYFDIRKFVKPKQ